MNPRLGQRLDDQERQLCQTDQLSWHQRRNTFALVPFTSFPQPKCSVETPKLHLCPLHIGIHQRAVMSTTKRASSSGRWLRPVDGLYKEIYLVVSSGRPTLRRWLPYSMRAGFRPWSRAPNLGGLYSEDCVKHDVSGEVFGSQSPSTGVYSHLFTRAPGRLTSENMDDRSPMRYPW